MAGEWIPIDCNLGTKPEVLEVVDETLREWAKEEEEGKDGTHP
jgi:hypothetical protein